MNRVVLLLTVTLGLGLATVPQFIVPLTTPAATPSSGPTVTWTPQTKTGTWPDNYGYSLMEYSALLGKTVLYGVVNSNTIYGSDIFVYDSTTHTFARHPNGNNTQNTTTSCLSGTGPTGYTGYERTVAVDGYVWPTDRHAEQMVVDNVNNRMWVFAGVCNQHIEDLPGIADRIWRFNFNSTFASSTWTKLSIAVKPVAGVNTGARLSYSSTDNIVLLQGGSGAVKTYVYCPTDANPTPGTLTPAQGTDGCTSADDFTEISVAGGVYPSGYAYGTIFFASSINKFLWFGGQTGGCSSDNACSFSQTWTYTPSTKTWANITPASQPPMEIGNYVDQPSMAFDTTNQKIWYRQLCQPGGVSTCVGTGAPKDWVYDIATNTYTAATTIDTSGGSGPVNDLTVHNAMFLAYDAAHGKIIGMTKNNVTAASNNPKVWEGTVSY